VGDPFVLENKLENTGGGGYRVGTPTLMGGESRKQEGVMLVIPHKERELLQIVHSWGGGNSCLW